MISLFIYAFLISVVVNLLVIHFSSKHDMFIDYSHDEKPQNFHDDCTSRAGGIGILAGLSMLFFTTSGLAYITPLLFAFGSGIFEDFHNSLSAKSRLLLQIIAASIAVWFTGAVVTYLGLDITLPYWAGIIFSIFAIVGMMNAVNIIDGFNGLASGVILIILASFTYIVWTHHNEALAQLIAVTSGAVFGFFILVFPKGKIFLGDGGAYMLGFLIALLGILLASTYKNVSPWYVLSIFIYPVWEVFFSIIRKFFIGLSPFKPDTQHFHMLVHRHLTKSNPLTALLILLLVLPFAGFSTYFAHNSKMNIYISLSFIIFYSLLYWYLSRKEKLTNV